MGDLEGVFNSFCAFGAGANAKGELDGAKFAKLCKDTKLVDKKFTATDVDLIFSKVKPKGGRTIDFATFQSRAVPEIAQRKSCTADDIVSALCREGAPTSSGTVADNVRFYDDKEAYTGVHKHGGPSTNDLGTSDLSHITNRVDADVRGVQAAHQGGGHRQSRASVGASSGSHPAPSAGGAAPAAPQGHGAARVNPLLHRLGDDMIEQALSDLEQWRERGIPALDDAIGQLRAAQSTRRGSAAAAPAGDAEAGAREPQPPQRRSTDAGAGGSRPQQRKSQSGVPAGAPLLSEDGAIDWGAVQELFNAFVAFGAGSKGSRSGAEMDNAKFAKFCKETGLVDKQFTATDADLIFSKVKPKGGRVIDFGTFKAGALPEIAARKKKPLEQVVASLRGGPQSSGTVADTVALHDDKENYTGVYKAGGPTTVDTGTSDLRFITNRADADVRGVQK
eukprot:TRINITY_DN1702_c0_g1_i1.p1 TRINITY_DN1702_c0_g1~~TRINITY_DN1702_c0_g1_i1.p1  ORF type:complete len:477 (+),score=162.54 TRINITY_DN1702_c0_g1_i1:85-1431(+)